MTTYRIVLPYAVGKIFQTIDNVDKAFYYFMIFVHIQKS